MEKTAFVTGADRSLGFFIARELLTRGYTVFAGRYLSKWNLLDELKKEYPDALHIVEVDVTDIESIRKAKEKVLEVTDSLDILVNNAGTMGKNAEGVGDIFDQTIDYDDILRQINVNALGSLRMCNVFVDLLMNSIHKLIVNISSEAGSIGTCWRYDCFGYCMSKAALNMSSALIHNRLHREFQGQVMDFNPGGMATQLGRTAKNDEMKETEKPTLRYDFVAPEDSARMIVDTFLNHEEYKSDHPAFLTRSGAVRIPW